MGRHSIPGPPDDDDAGDDHPDLDEHESEYDDFDHPTGDHSTDDHTTDDPSTGARRRPLGDRRRPAAGHIERVEDQAATDEQDPRGRLYARACARARSRTGARP